VERDTFNNSFELELNMSFAKWMVFLALVILTSLLPAHGQQSAPANTVQTASDSSSSKVIDYTLPPDKLQKSHALYLQTTRLQVIDTIYGFLVLLGLLYAGTVAKSRSLAESMSQRKWLQSFIVIPLSVGIA
jgi:hypothetical protein